MHIILAEEANVSAESQLEGNGLLIKKLENHPHCVRLERGELHVLTGEQSK